MSFFIKVQNQSVTFNPDAFLFMRIETRDSDGNSQRTCIRTFQPTELPFKASIDIGDDTKWINFNLLLTSNNSNSILVTRLVERRLYGFKRGYILTLTVPSNND